MKKDSPQNPFPISHFPFPTPNGRLPRIALVTDWLTNMGGAEKVVLAAAKAFPGAPIYTSVFTAETMPDFRGLDIRTTYLQKFPEFLRKKHQLFPVLRAYAFRHLDLSEYDVVLSFASAEAKAVRARPGAKHICYCHTPTRYYWSHYDEYRREPGFGVLNPLVRLIIPPFVWWMRRLDLRSVQGIDQFIANSSTVAERIQKYYHRDSTVLHPPVDMRRFRNLDINGKRSGFVALGRQVPYKRIDLAIQACNRLKLPLTVYGNGSEHERLVSMASPTVKFVTNATDDQIVHALASAEAYLMPQEDDFGIVQIEAMAAGTPVIAYGHGGSRDAVIEGKTGVFFDQQTVKSLVAALQSFDPSKFDAHEIQKYAEAFSEKKFISKLQVLAADNISN
jgi:glycosyltransferase involved in cell wall biosynthesis